MALVQERGCPCPRQLTAHVRASLMFAEPEVILKTTAISGSHYWVLTLQAFGTGTYRLPGTGRWVPVTGAWSLTPLRDGQHRPGNVVVHVRRVLHSAGERPIVTQNWVLDGDGSIALGNVPDPGNPAFECPYFSRVGNRLIMKNLRRKSRNYHIP